MESYDELRTIPVAPKYGVTPDGRVFSYFKSSFMKPSKKKSGYFQIPLRVEGEYKTFLIHRLVAITYLGESDLEVNHIDGDKANNNVSNLEWVTRADNLAHAREEGLAKKTSLAISKGGIGYWFPRGRDCMKATGLSQQDVSRLSTGKCKSAHGWQAA